METISNKKGMAPKWILNCLVITMVLSSCGSLENKPITEPLSHEEREELLAKDFDYFLPFLLIDIVDKRDTPLTASEIKSLKKLTYRQLKDFCTKWVDRDALDEKKSKYEDEWHREFETYFPKVDSISTHWRDFYQQYNPDNYLKLEIEEIIDKENVWLGEVQIKVKATPLKGTVNSFQANYGINGSMMGRNTMGYDTPFSGPKYGKAYLSFNYAFDIEARKVNELPLEELLKIYPFEYKITSITVNGKVIDEAEAYIKIPSSVKELWRDQPAEGSEWNDLGKKESDYLYVVRDLVNPQFPYEYDYVNDHICQDAYKDDKLAAFFYYEVANQK